MKKYFFKSESLKSNHPWIDSTNFSSTPSEEVLRTVLDKVEIAVKNRIKNGGKEVKVVFDLDSTIFDVKPRTLRIIKEFGATKEAKDISTEIAEWSQQITSCSLLYTLEERARAKDTPGTEEEKRAYFSKAMSYWWKRFFSDAYLCNDRPSAGAVDYVHKVVDLGAKVIYLTGRDWPGMSKGTKSSLQNSGFPFHQEISELYMKPAAGQDDAEFKDEVLREIRVDSEVIALFDNEPANFHVFEKNFPEAMLVFIHTNCSSKPAKPVKLAHKISDFLF
ncbi:MAG: HAD family hydrolase [Oligoflexia bacterium]|nr:HAD family hydrolase [Oligoflexia bacterium]